MSALVLAPMVVATTIDHKVVYLTAGDIVPSNVTPESLDHLISLGFVEPEPEPEPDPDLEPPSKSGPGSSAEAWREYAGKLEVPVADDASRDAVIAALTDAGLPTE